MRRSLENSSAFNDSNSMEYEMSVNMKRAVEYLTPSKLKIKWVRSHPEKYKLDLRSWNRDDFGIYGADWIAAGEMPLFFNKTINMGLRGDERKLMIYFPTVADMVDIAPYRQL